MDEKRKSWEEATMESHIVELATKLGLPECFFSDLGKEDDWSFIVKLHALIEAAVTQLLCYHFAEPKLEDVFSNLEMSNAKTGKIAFLKQAELLSEDYRKFILALSELRNKFVHNVGYCAKSIKDIISTYDKKQLESFALKFSPQDATMLRIANKPVKIKLDIEKPDIPKLVMHAVNDPKLHIWFGAYVLLNTIADTYCYSDYKQFTKALGRLNESELEDEIP